MQTIETYPGEHIKEVALRLVERAPARAMFNGIPVRAKYATTNAADVVRQWERESELRRITWEHSPAGKASRASVASQLRAAQSTMTAAVECLAALDLSDVPAVLAWVESVARAADHVGVVYDRAGVERLFNACGWGTGVNCGEAFDVNDARNFAGWIVGQWLTGYPDVARFIGEWRAKFTSVQG